MAKVRINIESIDGKLFKIKTIDSDNSKLASFTHYLHNHNNGVCSFYKKDALSYLKGFPLLYLTQKLVA